MPRCTAVLRRAEIWSISASLLRAPARLTFRPSVSPNQRWVLASAMRARRLPWIWMRRSRSAGSGRSRGKSRPVLVDARRVVGTAAVADGHFAVFEVAEKLRPFLVGWGAVLLAWA
jgi:hypothetical protein